MTRRIMCGFATVVALALFIIADLLLLDWWFSYVGKGSHFGVRDAYWPPLLIGAVIVFAIGWRLAERI